MPYFFKIVVVVVVLLSRRAELSCVEHMLGIQKIPMFDPWVDDVTVGSLMADVKVCTCLAFKRSHVQCPVFPDRDSQVI